MNRVAIVSCLMVALSACTFSSADRSRIDDRVTPATASIDDDGNRLTPLQRRVTDAAIKADMATIGDIQSRVAKLNDGGRELDSYHIAKAQAWVDFGRDEYTENDRSGVANAALREALLLVQAMEQDTSPLPMDTVLIETSVLLREDLWTLAENMKASPLFSCAEREIAQFEVQLVWSGHEQPELGWRHAAPYIRVAERLARDAQVKMAACRDRGVGQETQVADGGGCQNMCQMQAAPELPIPNNVHFARDRHSISPVTGLLLNRVAEFLMSRPDANLRLVGHTDPWNTNAYNVALAKRRSKAVRDYLVAFGIAKSRLQVDQAGESELVSKGCTPKDHAMNRRVMVEVMGVSDVTAVDQEADLQLDTTQNRCNR